MIRVFISMKDRENIIEHYEGDKVSAGLVDFVEDVAASGRDVDLVRLEVGYDTHFDGGIVSVVYGRDLVRPSGDIHAVAEELRGMCEGL